MAALFNSYFTKKSHAFVIFHTHFSTWALSKKEFPFNTLHMQITASWRRHDKKNIYNFASARYNLFVNETVSSKTRYSLELLSILWAVSGADLESLLTARVFDQSMKFAWPFPGSHFKDWFNWDRHLNKIMHSCLPGRKMPPCNKTVEKRLDEERREEYYEKVS